MDGCEIEEWGMEEVDEESGDEWSVEKDGWGVDE